MSLTTNDLDAFHRFAESLLASRPADSLQELVDIWELEHPPTELHVQNVAAIRAAIRDMDAGDVGRPAEFVVEELRRELASRHTS